MKLPGYCGVFLFLICIFCGCDTAVQTAAGKPRVRAAVESLGNGNVRFTVYAEGPDGNALTGAAVLVRNTANQVTVLDFDSETFSYTGTGEETSVETRYIFEVSSILSDEPITLSVPYAPVSAKPVVMVFRDAAGNSVLSGNTLDTSEEIQIAWDSCGDGVVYFIKIRIVLQIIYAVSTNAQTLTIPPNTIPPGFYTLEITAQKIYGDPAFRDASYYAISALQGSGLSFDAE